MLTRRTVEIGFDGVFNSADWRSGRRSLCGILWRWWPALALQVPAMANYVSIRRQIHSIAPNAYCIPDHTHTSCKTVPQARFAVVYQSGTV